MSQIKYLLYMAGEWLLGVTDLPSHPELCNSGDDSSFCFSRSKEDTCSAVESFAAVSTPNTPLTHMSLWYTTPHQFLLELLITTFVVLPIIIFGVMKMRALLSKTNLKTSNHHFGHKVRISRNCTCYPCCEPPPQSDAQSDANTVAMHASLLEFVFCLFYPFRHIKRQ